MPSAKLQFTGERFVPECQREIWYEHWHRYAFACGLARGRTVLDIACGEGYGASALADFAAQVIGIDISPQAIAHARARYAGKSNLNFVAGSCARIPLSAASVDTIVSFETIEHIREQREMLAEMRRVLKPDGLLILSSPNKQVYSDERGYHNEFHVRELYLEELRELLANEFQAVSLLGQKLVFSSAIWSLTAPSGRCEIALVENERVRRCEQLPYAPMYFIALCAARPDLLPQLEPALWLLGDPGESVYRHYDATVREVMQAGRHIAERDALLAQQAQELRDQASRFAAMEQQGETQARALQDLELRLRAREWEFAECRRHLAFCDSWRGWVRRPGRVLRALYRHLRA